MINYLETDIFTSTADTLVCPVNTVGVMGAGLAREFRKRYPKMFAPYVRACEVGQLRVGSLFTWHYREKSILCFPTKRHWREPSRLEDIVEGLRAFQRYEYGHVAIPKLGCGCGGLSWDVVVRPEMERYLGDLPIRVDVHLF